jgi:hypothetical protein
VAVRDEASVRRETNARMRASAFQMRREGAAFDSIGSRLGVNRGAARKLVQKEVRLLAGEADTEERRLLHAEALMDLWRVLYGPATAGDIDAIDRFLRVEERIASLLGLDRPLGGEGNGAVKIVLDRSEDEPVEGRRPRFTSTAPEAERLQD